jgi:hypothetical protein
VGREMFASDSDVAASQDSLKLRIGTIFTLEAESNVSGGYRYELFDPVQRNVLLGAFTQRVNSDFFTIGEDVTGNKVRPGSTLRHLHCAGVSSVVLSEDDPRCQRMHSPYDRSGIFLTPVVVAFPLVYFVRRYR